MRLRALVSLTIVFASLALATPARGMGDPDVAALQVGLRLKGLYHGTIDGIAGPGTTSAVRTLQQRRGLAIDGVPGKATRRALGHYARHRLGSRPIAFGKRGWDVAALQFLLAWHGFPSGTFDGHFGPHVDAALHRFQEWADLDSDGIAGPGTLAALRPPPPRSPLALAWPLGLPVGDHFGPRDAGFHPGIDIPAPAGLRVHAARAGTVNYAGWSEGGYGTLVVIEHTRGVTTMYAHLSRVTVAVGQRVRRGAVVGRVGTTGESTGPHLHFEVRVLGAAVDPLLALR